MRNFESNLTIKMLEKLSNSIQNGENLASLLKDIDEHYKVQINNIVKQGSPNEKHDLWECLISFINAAEKYCRKAEYPGVDEIIEQFKEIVKRFEASDDVPKPLTTRRPSLEILSNSIRSGKDVVMRLKRIDEGHEAEINDILKNGSGEQKRDLGRCLINFIDAAEKHCHKKEKYPGVHETIGQFQAIVKLFEVSDDVPKPLRPIRQTIIVRIREPFMHADVHIYAAWKKCLSEMTTLRQLAGMASLFLDDSYRTIRNKKSDKIDSIHSQLLDMLKTKIVRVNTDLKNNPERIRFSENEALRKVLATHRIQSRWCDFLRPTPKRANTVLNVKITGVPRSRSDWPWWWPNCLKPSPNKSALSSNSEAQQPASWTYK